MPRLPDREPSPLPDPFSPPVPHLPPAPPQQLRIPLGGSPNSGRIILTPPVDGKISLVVRDAPLNEVLGGLALQQGVNIVTGEDVTGKISVTLRDVTFEDALTSITAVGGFSWSMQNNIIHVTNLSAENRAAPIAQGRVVQVFPLNFVAASDVQTVAKGLLSPSGQIFSTLASERDNRKTRDVIVVEDLPAYIARVADYIAQVDHPPRQVLIEAHVLQVELTDDLKHGINWQGIGRLSGARLTLNTLGLAAAAGPTSTFTINGTDLTSLIEFLESTTDAKTLAQPRVLVLNGQQARVQIGQRYGYLVTTTTQTSTLQNVNFLDVGVLLTVKPQIADDQHVLLTVKPEVSDGSINPANNLPQQNTTEVETTVMLADGQGIVIGGLIKEQDIEKQSKVPLLGDMWLMGRLFQKRNLTRQRVEIIVALIPRVIPYSPDYANHDVTQYHRATTPLLEGALRPVDRPWEPKLPDSVYKPRKWCASRSLKALTSFGDARPNEPAYFFPTTDEVPWITPGDADGLPAAAVEIQPLEMPAPPYPNPPPPFRSPYPEQSLPPEPTPNPPPSFPGSAQKPKPLPRR